MEDKRRFGIMSTMTTELRNCETIKAKVDYFMALYADEYSEIKINFAVFNIDCKCVKIQKSVQIFELLKYIAWAGFRGSIDQILLKMKYCIEGNTSTIYNICLARDFNLNILVVKKPIELESKLA